MSAPEQTLIAYSQKRAGNNEVMRALVSHRGWFVPVGLFALTGESERRVQKMLALSSENLTPAGELWIFTSDEAALHATAKGASLGSYAGGMGGTELFRLIDQSSVQTVHVNPFSSVEQTWSFWEGSASTLGRLWAEVIALEEKFSEWEQKGTPDLAAIESCRAFLVFDHLSGPIVTLPNQGGLQYPAAAFTAPDCAQSFLDALTEEERSSIKQVEVDGKRLLTLPAICGVDGFFFNAFGPGPSYTLRC
jgi:hypothetical protein